jgi:hypothetical protein
VSYLQDQSLTIAKVELEGLMVIRPAGQPCEDAPQVALFDDVLGRRLAGRENGFRT